MKKSLKVLLVVIAIVLIVIFIERITRPNIDKLERSQDITKLILVLDHRSNDVRSDAENALIRIGSPAVEELIQQLENEDKFFRRKAAEILGEIGDERAFEPLTKLLNDEEESSVIRFAGEAITKFGQDGISIFIEIIKSQSRHTKSAALSGLAEIGQPAIASVLDLLDNPDKDVRDDAMWILEEINDPSIEPTLIALLDDDEFVYSASQMIVSFHNNDATILVPYLEDESTIGVYKALIYYGNIDTVEPLVDALTDYGNEKMAKDFLNSGQNDLEDAGKKWASRNGYTVMNFTTPINANIKWGSH